MNKKHSSSRAFVLLYSLLVASIVLAIGMSLATIISKQIILSSIGKMSRIAYYAADSGRDCAFFWAVKYGATVSKAINPEDGAPSPEIYCQGSAALALDPTDDRLTVISLLKMYGINDLLTPPNSDYRYFNFTQEITGVTGSPTTCNKFSVFAYPETSTSLYSTIIVSRGFSASCSATGPRTVGRSVINIIKR